MSKNKHNNVSAERFNPKPERYVVFHSYQLREDAPVDHAWAQYNTSLDGMGKVSAYSMAIHTASRYKGEVFADYGDGQLDSVKSYIKETK